MHTGPKTTGGYDLALTELIGDGEHRFVVDVGSEEGSAVLAEVAHRSATAEELAAAVVVANTSAGRAMHFRRSA